MSEEFQFGPDGYLDMSQFDVVELGPNDEALVSEVMSRVDFDLSPGWFERFQHAVQSSTALTPVESEEALDAGNTGRAQSISKRLRAHSPRVERRCCVSATRSSSRLPNRDAASDAGGRQRTHRFGLAHDC